MWREQTVAKHEVASAGFSGDTGVVVAFAVCRCGHGWTQRPMGGVRRERSLDYVLSKLRSHMASVADEGAE